MKTKILFLFIFSLVISCNNGISDMNRENIVKIVYRFKDSSTPPRYHRSYKITVKIQTVQVRVDVYGTELANETYPIESSVFDNLVSLTKNLDAPGRKVASGATGTKGYTISLYHKEGELYKLHWDSLNKDEISQGSFDFVEKIIELVPQLGELKKRELPRPDSGE